VNKNNAAAFYAQIYDIHNADFVQILPVITAMTQNCGNVQKSWRMPKITVFMVIVILWFCVYFRVMVLQNGEIIEFDSPTSLLANGSSQFYNMARDAGLVWYSVSSLLFFEQRIITS